MILLLTLRHLNTEWAQQGNSHHVILRRGPAFKGGPWTVHFFTRRRTKQNGNIRTPKNLKNTLNKEKKTTTVGCNLTVQREENTDSSAREAAGGCSGIAFAASGAKPKPNREGFERWQLGAEETRPWRRGRSSPRERSQPPRGPHAMKSSM